MKNAKLVRIVSDLASAAASATLPPPQLAVLRAVVRLVGDEVLVSVACADGRELDCEVIEPLACATFAAGERVLVSMPDEPGGLGIVLGRITRVRTPEAPKRLVLEATEAVSLVCGQSSIELRPDGQLAIRGEDVLVRAKGSKRIRAGTVSIN